jgi:type I restriction enzyme S subunit
VIRTYPALAASGTPWLVDIPQHWSVGRLAHVAVAWTSNVDKHSVDGQPAVRLCNYTDVYKNDSIDESMNFMWATATEEQIERFRLRRGDTLITKDSETADDIGVPAYVEYEADDLICGYHLALIRPKPDAIVPRFLYWAMGARPTHGQWAVQASGVTRVGIRSADLAKVTLAFPSLPEQQAIADFLDRETARIDTLIEEQQRLVEMLRERRWAVVEGSVARLDWSTPFKSVAALIQTGPFGSQLKADEYEDGGIPVINPSHLAGGFIVADPRIAVGPTKALKLARHAFEVGDLAVARRGELGRCAVVDESAEGFLCGTGSALVRLDLTRMFPRFAATVFGSRRNRDALALASVGSTMDNLNADIIGTLRIPVPALEEQRQIVASLEKHIAKVDDLVAETERFVELSRERRSALITAAVTGQIDVRVEVA